MEAELNFTVGLQIGDRLQRSTFGRPLYNHLLRLGKVNGGLMRIKQPLHLYLYIAYYLAPGSLLGYSGVHAICTTHLHHKQGCLEKKSVYTLRGWAQIPIFSMRFPTSLCSIPTITPQTLISDPLFGVIESQDEGFHHT